MIDIVAPAIFSVGSVLFSIALLPSALRRAGRDIPTITSALTSGILWAFALTYLLMMADYGWFFFFAFSTTVTTASLWTILLIQAVSHDN